MTENEEGKPLKLGRRGTRSDGLHIKMYKNRDVDENGVMWVKSRCWGCHCNCGMLVGVNPDGTINEIRPNEEQDTVMCERVGEHGERMIKFHYHKDRVNYALKRVGERGSGEWEQIPYEQALDEIAERLDALRKEYGAETLAIAEGTYRSGHLWARSRFTNLFGNPCNLLDPGQICWCWIYAINMAICGFQIELSLPPTIFYSDCIVLWGINPNQKYGPKGPAWRLYEQVLAKPVRPRLIVVDPEGIEMTRHCDYWIQPRPGSDLAIMLAWIETILADGLYDEAFLKNWTNAAFLIDAESKQLIRGNQISADARFEDFVGWDETAGEPVVWLSDECRYAREDVANELWTHEDHTITLLDGKQVKVRTAMQEIWNNVRECTPEWASEISGAPARKIREAAQCYANNRPGVIIWGIGGGDQVGYNATGCAIAKTLLRAITGNVDVLGGEYVGEPGPIMKNGMFPLRESEMELSHMVKPETRQKLLGGDVTRLVGWQGFELIDECFQKMWRIPRPMVHQLLASAPIGFRAMSTGKPYPVKALIAWSSNPMLWMGDTHMVYEGLKNLDLLVVVDYWITPTAALADYVMPAADWMERPTCTTSEDASDYMVLGDRAVVPEGERHVDYDFFRGLGIRLGQEEYWPWPTYEDSIEYRVARCGLTYEEAIEEGALFSEMRFNKHEEILPNGQHRGFATRSRRMEIFSSIIQECGYDPVPHYRELPETKMSDPEMAKEYPITCTTGGRFIPMYHSEFRQLGLGTREMWPWPTFTINRRTAQDLGIRDGDWCWIENKRGRIRQKAKLTTSIDLDTITVQASWWFPELPMKEPWLGGVWESNANVLTNADIETQDPACGCWYARGFLVKVYRCDEAFPSEHIVPTTPIEDEIPPYIPPAERGLTPIGPVREDNYGPYGPEWGTCPDTPMEWAITE